jgi:hypothetical protein
LNQHACLKQNQNLWTAPPRLRFLLLSARRLTSVVLKMPRASFRPLCAMHMLANLVLLGALAVAGLSYRQVRGTPYTVGFDHRAVLVNGERVLLLSGSIHYPRSTPTMWPDLMRRSAEAHLNAIQTYVFWNYHEPARGEYDFASGSRNLTLFLDAAAGAGLWVVLRIGPYVCGEWSYGGIPVWLRDDPAIVFRDADTPWLTEAQAFLSEVLKRVEPYLARNGGPIILAQIENEYGNVESAYGAGGPKYVQWNAQTALSSDIEIPWIMCQQSDAPAAIINTCNGFYCDNFLPGHFRDFPDQPAMWTENWAGWFQRPGEPVPHRPPEDLAFAGARWFARGGTHHNLYMLHGGTTFDRWTGGPWLTPSYDYDAPLDEFGLPSQPKYAHLQLLQRVLTQYASAIVGHEVPVATILGPGQEAHAYGDPADAGSLVFLSNWNASGNATVWYRFLRFLPPRLALIPPSVQGRVCGRLVHPARVVGNAGGRRQPGRPLCHLSTGRGAGAKCGAGGGSHDGFEHQPRARRDRRRGAARAGDCERGASRAGDDDEGCHGLPVVLDAAHPPQSGAADTRGSRAHQHVRLRLPLPRRGLHRPVLAGRWPHAGDAAAKHVGVECRDAHAPVSRAHAGPHPLLGLSGALGSGAAGRRSVQWRVDRHGARRVAKLDPHCRALGRGPELGGSGFSRPVGERTRSSRRHAARLVPADDWIAGSAAGGLGLGH